MTITVDPSGNLYSNMDCLHCDDQGPHAHYDVRGDQHVFQCGRCFGMFTDASPAPSTWLPGPRG